MVAVMTACMMVVMMSKPILAETKAGDLQPSKPMFTVLQTYFIFL